MELLNILCDMFHVQLVVFNTSTQEFITDCEAKLCLPDGLALAKMIEGKSNEAIKKLEGLINLVRLVLIGM